MGPWVRCIPNPLGCRIIGQGYAQRTLLFGWWSSAVCARARSQVIYSCLTSSLRFLAIEAPAHGLVTVAYATGGVVEAAAAGRSGRLAPPHEAAEFADAVCGLIETPSPTAGIEALARDYARGIVGKRLTAVF